MKSNYISILNVLSRTLSYLEEVAVRTAENLANGSLKIKREKSLSDNVLDSALKVGFVKDQIFNKAKGQVMKQTNGLYPAPLKVRTLIINLLFQKLISYYFCVVDFGSSENHTG